MNRKINSFNIFVQIENFPEGLKTGNKIKVVYKCQYKSNTPVHPFFIKDTRICELKLVSVLALCFLNPLRFRTITYYIKYMARLG